MSTRLGVNVSGPFVAYLVLSLVLWSGRLFAILHAESAAVIAFAGFFIAGTHALSPANQGLAVRRLLVSHLFLLICPLSLLTLSLLWLPNCGYWTGLLLFGLFAVPSVILAIGMASWIRTWHLRGSRTTFISIGFLILVVGVLYDLGLHPQFYVLNHVFGALLGPIYEDALYVRPGLFVFRALTLLWATLFFLLAVRFGRVDPPDAIRLKRLRVAIPLVAMVIGATYLFSTRLGINTSYGSIVATLGSVAESEHFEIIYDSAVLGKEEIARVVADHEFGYARIRDELGVEPDRRIRSYLYPTVRSKIELTGAGVTDVSPVWLRVPQMHLLMESYPATLSHELVHVFSREIGIPILRASLLAGLLEGLAVALQDPDGRPTIHEQASVAVRSRSYDVGIERALAQEVTAMLDPLSFWTQRAPVSYTLTGSFVRYLLERYGPHAFAAAYPTGRFRRAYGIPLRRLAEEWESYVGHLPVISLSARDHVFRRFSIPSLFEKRCPHYQPRHVASYLRARDCLARLDTLGSIGHLEDALSAQEQYVPALTQWSRLALAQGDWSRTIARVRAIPDSLYSPSLHVSYGDALALSGDTLAALVQYQSALRKLPSFERDARALVLLRGLSGGSPEPAILLHALAEVPPYVRAEVNRRAMHALRLGHEARHAEAADLLADLDWNEIKDATPGERAFMHRMTTLWAARYRHHAGQTEEAERLYERSRQEAANVGDFNHVAQIEHQIRRLTWSISALGVQRH